MLFIIHFLLCALFISGFTEKFDEEIDYYIQNINDAIYFFNDGIELPDVNTTLTQGYLKLAPNFIKRTGNSMLKVKDNRIHFYVSIGFEEVDVFYHFSYGIIGVPLQVKLSGISQPAELLVVHQDGNSCAVTVTDARFHLSKIKINAPWYANWIIKIVLWFIDTESKANDAVNDVIKEYLNKPFLFDCYKIFADS